MIRRNRTDSSEIDRRLQDTRKIEQILTQVRSQVVREHARSGRQMPMWKDGSVVWGVPPMPEESAQGSADTGVCGAGQADRLPDRPVHG
jgi:hypothetical protein